MEHSWPYVAVHHRAGRLALVGSAILGLGLCYGPTHAHADAVAFAGGDANAAYDIVPLSGTQTTSINHSDQEQGASGATAGASASTGMLSYSTIISDGNGGYIPFTYQAQASGAFTASASFGTLHAQGTAGYELIPGSTTVIGYDSSGQPYYSAQNNPITVASGGSAYASFEDQFTITSSTLAYGAPVQLRITGFLEAGSNGGTAILASDVDSDYSSTPDFGGPARDLYLEISNDGQQLGTRSIILTAYVGIPEYLNATLSAGASVPFGVCEGANYPWGYDQCAGQSAYENALDTANIYVDPLGSDYSIAFDSGHDYSTPAQPTGVPEPGTLAILVGGLLGLGLVRRRQLG